MTELVCVHVVVYYHVSDVNLTSPAVVIGRQGASWNRGCEVVLEVKMITGETVHTVGSRDGKIQHFYTLKVQRSRKWISNSMEFHVSSDTTMLTHTMKKIWNEYLESEKTCLSCFNKDMLEDT